MATQGGERSSLPTMVALRLVGAALLAAAAVAPTVPSRTPLALDSAAGHDGPSCGAAAAPCKTLLGAMASAQAQSLTTVSLQCAEGQYPIAKLLPIPSGADVEITLTSPPAGRHQSFLACAEGLALPCITVGDGAVSKQ